jgi:hemoglobin/transferrin/lactoferrin receptor protein
MHAVFLSGPFSSSERFKPGSWKTLDLACWWKPAKRAQLNLAVNNLLDEKYWLWGDVRQADLKATDAGPGFYTQPGRNVAASFKYQF